MNKAVQLSPLFHDPTKFPMDDEVVFTSNGHLSDAILAFSEKISLPVQETLKQDCTAFYYVQKGTIEVSHTTDDTKITVALLGSGDFFGEIGFFDGGSRVRDIRATKDAEIFRFDVAVIEKMFYEKPDLYGRLVTSLTKLICRKFRRVLEENEPLIGYAASLASKRRGFNNESRPIPTRLLNSPGWYQISNEVETLKAQLFNLSFQLQKDLSQNEPDPEIIRACYTVLDTINGNLAKYKTLMTNQEDRDYMWGYIFKEIFPYIMRSRFVERAYYKPKGYAGDFLMMEHIYKDQAEGDGKLGKIVDAWCLQRPGAKAIRGRRILLSSQLASWTQFFLKKAPRVKIMNLACGPNRELFDFLSNCEYTHAIEALCVDIDSEALHFTGQHVNVFPHEASINLMSENLVKWALGRVRHEIGQQHIIYSAGLCDYLDRRLFQAMIKRCYEHLEPGGKLMLGNFAPYPDQIFMDEILHWKLLYRTGEDLADIFADTPFGSNVEILAEEEKVNLFVLATKEG